MDDQRLKMKKKTMNYLKEVLPKSTSNIRSAYQFLDLINSNTCLFFVYIVKRIFSHGLSVGDCEVDSTYQFDDAVTSDVIN